MSHRFKVVQGGPYPHFVTLSIVRWLPVFISGPYFKIVLDSLKYLKENRALMVHAYVIMPTHVHTILTARNDDLSEIIRDFKRFTAGSIEKQSELDGNRLQKWVFANAVKDSRARSKVWQDEFHPEVIHSKEFFQQKANYIHANPMRKGLVEDVTYYQYSSATAFERGEMGLLDIDWLDW
jgi:REP element-mobilizing transposase RayT